MTPRRKPIPTPIARPSDVGLAARPLAPVRNRSILPTVAALLALGAVGCDNGSESIVRDSVMSATMTHIAEGNVTPRITSAESGEADPVKPLPGMGALEEPPPAPPPVPAPTVVTPPKHPYPVKGGMKSVHPIPSTPPAPGGLKAVHPPPPPPIAPTAKPPKLGGDVAVVETT